MALDPKFTKFSTASPVLANFSFTNLIEGNGYIGYNFIVGETDTTKQFSLISFTATGSEITTSSQEGTAGVFTFDTGAYVISQIVEGIAYFEGDYTAQVTSPLNIQIFHYDGTTETAISSALDTQDVLNGTTEATFLQLPLTKKSFKVGDKIRVKITFSSVQLNNRVSFDPTYTGINPCKIYIPFKL